MAASDPHSTARLTTVLTRIQLLMIVGSVAAVGFLVWQVGPLLKQRDELKGEIKTATAQLGAVKTELQALESQRKTLQDDIAKLKSDNRMLETDRNVLSKSLLDSGGGGRTQAIVEAAVSGIRDPEQISPRIYVHVTTTENEKRAREVARELQQAGFIVPSIQRVTAVPSTPQLRYFRPADLKDAQRAISAIGERITGIKAVEFRDPDLTRKPTAMRPRHLELWF